MRIGIQTGIQITKGGSFIDPEAQILYDRVIADGGIVPAGLSGMDAYIKAAKAARGISTLAQGYLSLAHPHYTGIRLATGTGPTAGNRAARTVYNAIGAIGDFIQTTAANQPLALVHSGQNYAWLPGVSGNYFGTPNATANQVTGNIQITANINPSVLTSDQNIVNKSSVAGTTMGYNFFLNSSGGLSFAFSPTGAVASRTTVTSTVSLASVGILPNTNFWVRVTRNSVSGDIQFFTSIDGVVFTQLGSTVSSITGNLFSSTEPLFLGTWADTLHFLTGKINRVTISNTIGGNPVVDFNPANYSRATSGTTWTSTTGEVWTLNTPATNNALKAAIVDTTMVMGNGTSYGLQAASLNINQSAITSYTAFRKYVNTAGLQVINELGANATTNAGKALYLNTQANQEDVWLFANVGGYNSRFTSTNLGLKLATAVNNIANANESSPYLINNSSQTFVASDSTFNNTANMNATGYNLLARNNAASLWANAIIVSDCVAIGEDNTTQRTSMYNFFKTYINGI